MKMRLTCTVNDEPVDVLADDYKTLLEVLREDLQLTGTKHGCELGECGACAVLVDGAAGAVVPGAGGRMRGPAGHHRRRPGRRRSAPSAAGLLRRPRRRAVRLLHAGHSDHREGVARSEPHPSRERICEALSGNLCRCTGYLQIVEAVEAAASRRAPDRDRSHAMTAPDTRRRATRGGASMAAPR